MVRPEYLNIIQVKFTLQWTVLWLWRFSRRPVITDPRGKSQVSPYEICGGQSGTGTGFSPSTSGFACQYYSTGASYSPTCCCYYKDKRANPRNIPEINALSEIRGY
jgi:hypothetical protein